MYTNFPLGTVTVFHSQHAIPRMLKKQSGFMPTWP